MSGVFVVAVDGYRTGIDAGLVEMNGVEGSAVRFGLYSRKLRICKEFVI